MVTHGLDIKHEMNQLLFLLFQADGKLHFKQLYSPAGGIEGH